MAQMTALMAGRAPETQGWAEVGISSNRAVRMGTCFSIHRPLCQQPSTQLELVEAVILVSETLSIPVFGTLICSVFAQCTLDNSENVFFLNNNRYNKYWQDIWHNNKANGHLHFAQMLL